MSQAEKAGQRPPSSPDTPDPDVQTTRARAAVDRDPAHAILLAEQAAALARANGDELQLARNLATIGEARIRMRDYGAAEAVLRAALPLAEPHPALGAVVRRGLLRCAFFANDHANGFEHGVHALELSRQAGDRRLEALSHNDLALICGSRADYQGALEHLLPGLQLLSELEDGDLGSVLNNIGNVYTELGEHTEALDFFQRAKAAFRERGAANGEAIAVGNVGRALMGTGDLVGAREAFAGSLRGFEAQGDAAYLAPAQARLASADASLGDLTAAARGFARACDALDGTEHREFADEVLLAAGRFHLERGDAGRATELFRRALDGLPAGERSNRVAELHRALSDALERLDEPASALRHFREFHQIREEVADGASTLRIRGMMLQFDVERARQQQEIYRLRNVELARAYDELRSLHEQLEEQNVQLQQLSVEDALTGVHNRRYLDAQLHHEIARSIRRRRPLVVALCDIDHFKRINDNLSHAVGDEVLRVMGELFRTTIRQDDVVARYGGEEFVVILPETDLAGAAVLAERLRTRVAEHPWAEMHPELEVTLSIGLGALEPAGPSADAMLAAADGKLYEAKRAGRNRVCS
jgi:diguanylate cyclase (GGDEF)-like protein